MQPTVTQLPDRTVVDFGPKWFVFYNDRRIVRKVAKGGRVESKEITKPSIRHQVRRYCGMRK